MYNTFFKTLVKRKLQYRYFSNKFYNKRYDNMSGAKIIYNKLLENNVNTVNGFSGGANLPLLDCFHPDNNNGIEKINELIAKHEEEIANPLLKYLSTQDNIRLIDNPIEKVSQIRGVQFEWNDKQETYPTGSKDSGIIAQDVQKVLPELVKERKDGYLGVRHDRLVGLLIESIKEQQKQLDELKKEIKKIKGDE